MNLFRSEEHVKRWPLYFQALDDYVMPIADWADVFSVSMFRNRLAPDYLAHSAEYLEDYRQALLAKGKAIPMPDRELVTVMFTDIVDSTRKAAEVGDDAWRTLLDRHDAVARREIPHHRGRVVKHTGDGVLAVFNSPTQAIQCTLALREAMAGIGLAIRIGLHSGECEVFGDDIGGIGVHIGARVAAAAGAGEILVSRGVADSVTGSGITFTDQGMHTLKGVPGTWQLLSVDS